MSRIYISLLACAFPLYAQPKGGNITHGNAQITQHSNETHITTKTDKTVIGWKDFSVGKGEMVNFHQPSALSAVLNRVLGQNPSAILGLIESNGQVYLLNPNGILFGEGATVNVSSLIASTLDIHDKAFLNGSALEFMGDSQGSIKNLGTIKTSDGDALLIGRFVENSEILEAHEGEAGALACTYFLYHPNSNEPFYIKADSPSDLNTDGNAFSHAISTDADPDAFTITRKNGEVYLTSAKNSGTIRSKKGENGGAVNILGDRVELEETSIIDVSGKNQGGHVQVGGSFQGKDPNVLASQLTFVKKGSHIDASALEEGNGGFIEVSDPTNLLAFRGDLAYKVWQPEQSDNHTRWRFEFGLIASY